MNGGDRGGPRHRAQPGSTGRLYSHLGIRYRLIADAPLVAITLAWPRLAPQPLVAEFVAVASRTSRFGG
jgi:hypothetical protein